MLVRVWNRSEVRTTKNLFGELCGVPLVGVLRILLVGASTQNPLSCVDRVLGAFGPGHWSICKVTARALSAANV